jgi:hypothetical protein
MAHVTKFVHSQNSILYRVGVLPFCVCIVTFHTQHPTQQAWKDSSKYKYLCTVITAMYYLSIIKTQTPPRGTICMQELATPRIETAMEQSVYNACSGQEFPRYHTITLWLKYNHVRQHHAAVSGSFLVKSRWHQPWPAYSPHTVAIMAKQYNSSFST